MGNVGWKAVSVAVCDHPKAQMVGLGEWGQAWFSGAGDEHEELIADGDVSTEGRGPLRCVRAIDKKAWAVGMDRQVYRREGVNKWACLDASMRPKEGEDDVVGFESVAGFSSKEVYTAGWGGEIWRFDGSRWKKIDSPTNQLITGLACGDDGNVYACGRLGLLLSGKGSKWKVIDHGATHEDLSGIDWYDGKLYLASLEQLWQLDGDALTPVEFDDDRPKTCNHLSAADGLLWSIGPKDLFRFDGTEWTRVD